MTLPLQFVQNSVSNPAIQVRINYSVCTLCFYLRREKTSTRKMSTTRGLHGCKSANLLMSLSNPLKTSTDQLKRLMTPS